MFRNDSAYLWLGMALVLTMALLGAAPASAQFSGDGPCLDLGDHPFGGGCCGDGVCEPGEDCPIDCTICGDNFCSPLESCLSCAADCGACPTCGDGVCNGTETCSTCSTDCTSCFAAPFQAFHRGEDTLKIFTTYSHNGYNWSTSRSLGNGAISNASPAAVVFNDRMYVFYKAYGGHQIYYSWSDDGLFWQGDIPLGNGAETDRGIGAAVFNNRIYVFNKGRQHHDLWVSYSSDGTSWPNHYKISIEGDEVNGPPTAAVLQEEVNGEVVAEKLFVYYRHSSSEIKGVSSSNGFSFSEEPTINTNRHLDGVGLAAFDGRLYIAEVRPSTLNGIKRTIYIRSRTLTSGWSTQAQTFSNGAFTDHRPALAASDDRLVLTFKGRTSNKVFYAYSFDGVNWLGDNPASGSTIRGLSLIHTD